MRKILLLAGLAVGLAACGQSTPSSSGTGTGGTSMGGTSTGGTSTGGTSTSPINVTGTWNGFITTEGAPSTTDILYLMQASGSDDITGTDEDGATISGKHSTGVLIFTVPNVSTTVYTGTFTAMTYKGTLMNNGQTSKFVFTKSQ